MPLRTRKQPPHAPPPTHAALATPAERFRIDRPLASGGMGSVFVATDRLTGDTVALKRLRVTTGARDHAWFEREYQTLVSIQHPRIVKAFDYGVDASGPYYTMELIEGTDLHELSPIQARDACRHIRDVASCLALLHTRRLLHRDITPRNVRVLADGTCKLLDFGALASFGVPDRIIGTPPFVPPEALEGAGALDQRADIFSLGALLYWTLTRKHGYPARRIEALPETWKQRPIAPRSLNQEIPPEVDALVLRMLAIDPMARPETMAEVVERLNAAANLEPEPDATRRALAHSYLAHADCVGRDEELHALRDTLARVTQGQGGATLIEGTSGVGRTRILQELQVLGEVQGFTTLHIDGDECRRDDQAAVSIVRHLLTTSAAARQQAPLFAASLLPLGPGIAEHVSHVAQGVRLQSGRGQLQECVLAMVRAACAQSPLLITVDNLDEVDDASLATLASLTRLSSQVAFSIALTTRTDVTPRTSVLWHLLREQCEVLSLEPLSPEQALLLARSMFGEVPNLVRCARWLHQLSGGLPLHFVELARQLYESGEIIHEGNQWRLPDERPEQIADENFAVLIAARLDRLSPAAYGLAEALSVQRTALSRALCADLARADGHEPRALLDELSQRDVLMPSLYGFAFAHALLRDRLLARMSPERLRVLHLRCAEQALADVDEHNRRRAWIEAGWHLLQAGEESRGAERIAEAAVDTIAVRYALADTPEYAPALATALDVYVKQKRSLYERLPLTSTLATAGYYGDRSWGERYGDIAIDAVETIAGLKLARRLRPVLGRTLSVLVALLIAFVRFSLLPKRGPRYGFRDVMVQLFGVVTTLTGAASIALDVDRAARIAATLEPFLGLPRWMTPVGIAQFCAGLKEIARDNQAQATRSWTTLLARFRDPRFYPSMPPDGRTLYIGGLLFALGANSVFRDSKTALEAADELDALDIKLYRMIASAIRAQYYAHRGQLEDARRCRRQVDDHAVQLGSAWQAELWEPASLILVHTTMGDVAQMRRVTDRLQALATEVPSLARYARFAELALLLTREEDLRSTERDTANMENVWRSADAAAASLRALPPRAMVGWAATGGYCARAFNLLGRHEEARALCREFHAQLRDDDREFVAMYLNLDLELAVADAHLGDRNAAIVRLDQLLVRHQHSDNPLTRGRIHEAYARVMAALEAWEAFRHHVEQASTWYGTTGSASLFARVESLRGLDPTMQQRAARATTATVKTTAQSLGIELPRESDVEAQQATSQELTAALPRNRT